MLEDKKQIMAPSQMNLSAIILVVVLLPVVIAARESTSIGSFLCPEHLSGNYKGICIGLIHDAACNRVCIEESSDNYEGFCNFFQCWCQPRCTSKTEVDASAPIRQ
ncbi:hypothetical protein BDA96_10G291800 [Sorghum bicolor]|uniref:Knottin scorpion toxin-like domain-containing protein n=2 Tax=Sorghum bicolor TaxID=4558 RepID=A0A921Q4U6_SORBI|nr:hypothetical protein BDA96_10G291800 [Sorghum bicolor]OQU76868.1 hypothetical protein SORBI_3010G225251 [Sorghum bicolor]